MILFLDVGQYLLRGCVRGRPVADHRARVADEVGQRHDAPLVQDLGSGRGVGDVGSGRYDPDTGRK